MNEHLTQWFGLTINTANDHKWDAALSCFAVLEGISGHWTTDLHQLPTEAGEELVQIGEKGKITGKLSPIDLLRGLETNYNRVDAEKTLSRFGLSNVWKSLREDYNLCRNRGLPGGVTS